MKLVTANEEQKRQRDVVCAQAWGERLTLEQFLDRELRLRAHPWARANLETWLWCAEDGQVLASCETYRMRSLVGTGAGRTEGDTWGIASVFTEPHLRGRGHAGRMMAALLERLGARSTAQASILFSEVGAELYERAGYVSRPIVERRSAAEPGALHELVDAIVTEDALGALFAEISLPDVAFLVWPTADQLDWHLERERLYAEYLSRPRPRFHGARVGESRAIWAGALKYDVLKILLLDAKNDDDAQRLIRAARAVAHDAGIASVRDWVPVPALDPNALPEDLPMIAPLHPEVRATDWRYALQALWM